VSFDNVRSTQHRSSGFWKILPDTYQPMPSYRLCTSDGPTLLTEGLAAKLKLVLEGTVAREAAQ
jgi:hypothetical protein